MKKSKILLGFLLPILLSPGISFAFSKNGENSCDKVHYEAVFKLQNIPSKKYLEKINFLIFPRYSPCENFQIFEDKTVKMITESKENSWKTQCMLIIAGESEAQELKGVKKDVNDIIKELKLCSVVNMPEVGLRQ